MVNPRIKAVQYKDPHKLVITFSNDEIKLFDLSSYLKYPVYKPLQDPVFCKKAKVAFGTVVWDDVIDFGPDTLYLESKPYMEKISG